MMSLPKEIMSINQNDVQVFFEPYCDVVDLPFTMETFDHLESIQARENVTMLPETDISNNFLVESEDFFGHLVHKSLKTVHVCLTIFS